MVPPKIVVGPTPKPPVVHFYNLEDNENTGRQKCGVLFRATEACS